MTELEKAQNSYLYTMQTMIIKCRLLRLKSYSKQNYSFNMTLF